MLTEVSVTSCTLWSVYFMVVCVFSYMIVGVTLYGGKYASFMLVSICTHCYAHSLCTLFCDQCVTPSRWSAWAPFIVVNIAPLYFSVSAPVLANVYPILVVSGYYPPPLHWWSVRAKCIHVHLPKQHCTGPTSMLHWKLAAQHFGYAPRPPIRDSPVLGKAVKHLLHYRMSSWM